MEYINSGRNILWFNAAITEVINMPNVNKILAEYGVEPFEVGIIRETDSSKMIMNSQDLILPNIQYSAVTKDLITTTGIILVNSTKININEEKLEELNVVKTQLALASEKSYFRTEFTNQSSGKADEEESGEFVVGAEFEKTIKEANEELDEKAINSKLIIFAENYFVTDYQLNQDYAQAAIQYAYNKDLVLNSIAYLVDREEDITVRKSTGTVTYTATASQDITIRIVIFAVPVLIIILGIIVWQIRRRKR